MKFVSLIVAAAAIVASVSCSKNKDDNKINNNPRKSIELSTKSAEFVKKGEAFTFDLIKRIEAAETERDYIISPLSLQFNLGMILNGANGETADQICNVLGYGAGEVDTVNEYAFSMLQQLPGLDKKTTLTVANAIFLDNAAPILETYRQSVGDYYKAEAQNLDFYDKNATLKAINDWARYHTGGLIPECLDKISEEAMAYLLNAICFSGKWRMKFEQRSTSSEVFTDESGARRTVSMMKQEDSFNYQENDIFKAVELAYGNGAFSMNVLLPLEGYTTSDIATYLGDNGWRSFRKTLVDCRVDLWLPKFETDYDVDFTDVLMQMGMPLAFTGEADFSALTSKRCHVDFVKQNASIKIDEDGAKVAAVTVSSLGYTTVGPGSRVVFHADHPFLYLITEKSTGAVLFAGKFSGGKAE